MLLFRTTRAVVLAGLLAGGISLPGQAATDLPDSGAYLAANTAFEANDFREAAAWYARARLPDPDNPTLLERLSLTHMALGEVAAAATAAREAERLGPISQALHLAILADAAQKGDFDALLAAKPQDHPMDRLTLQLLQGWAQMGKGQMSAARETFQGLGGEFAAFGLYHQALALAVAGDLEGAEAILSGKSGGLGLSLRGIVARVQVLSQMERNPEALAFLEESFGSSTDPLIADLRRRLAAGEPLDFLTVRGAQDGLAEAFLTIAEALEGEPDKLYALLFARAALASRPDLVEAQMLSGDLLIALNQNALAAEAFLQVPQDHPERINAQIAAATAAEASGDRAAALEMLRGLAKANPDSVAVLFALGDTLRRAESCAEAVAAYDLAMGQIAEKDRSWQSYFNRGSCQERLGKMEPFEADMRAALERNPNQPQVLNYLGYSLVDRGLKLDEALGMIKRAVAQEPQAGYIIDSLAWAYYRLGRYQDALLPMERAAQLEPVDPVVTDHLGDVYWAVGRKREAEFQWHRALSFNPTEKDAARIRAKLEKGLDAVLEAEGGRPISPPEGADGG